MDGDQQADRCAFSTSHPEHHQFVVFALDLDRDNLAERAQKLLGQ
jgi:hypothetical protein